MASSGTNIHNCFLDPGDSCLIQYHLLVNFAAASTRRRWYSSHLRRFSQYSFSHSQRDGKILEFVFNNMHASGKL
jgi:hypothetical protein